MYCEHCGLQIMPQKPVCSRCGVSPTYYWVQLTGLLILLLALLVNSLVAWFLLPRMAANHPGHRFFSDWAWTDRNISMYGWAPIAVALLVWDILVWQKVKKAKAMPKIKGWLSRKMLTFVLAAGFAPILPWWIPAGQPSEKVMSTLATHPGLPALVSWSAILVACALLCVNAETREMLLGRGKALSIVSIGVLALVFGLTVFGWSLT
ncbi:MAG TPA: hypothetical protein VKD70_02925 [Candidatus Acidoferrum sp.]|nr:hypothetical protein [Candidatus Acidoferrum sp.]